MGGGYRSPAYLIRVIGGLVTIVGVSVGLGFANPADQRVIFAILPLVGVWVAGILVMQARFAARAAGGELAFEADDEPRPGDDPPTERAELARALAVNPLDPEAERAARKGSRGIALGQVGYTAVLMLLILVGVGLFYGGVGSTLYPLGESGPGVPVGFLPILVALLVGVVRIPFTIARSVAATSAQLEPLRLAMTETPRIGVRPKWGGSGMRTDVQGPSVISGRRHGRAVRAHSTGQ